MKVTENLLYNFENNEINVGELLVAI